MKKNTKLFKNLTLTQKSIMYFKEYGAIEIEVRTNKYRVFKYKTGFIFFGKGAAIRYGKTKASTKTISVSDKFKKIISLWAKTQDQNQTVNL